MITFVDKKNNKTVQKRKKKVHFLEVMKDMTSGSIPVSLNGMIDDQFIYWTTFHLYIESLGEIIVLNVLSWCWEGCPLPLDSTQLRSIEPALKSRTNDWELTILCYNKATRSLSFPLLSWRVCEIMKRGWRMCVMFLKCVGLFICSF